LFVIGMPRSGTTLTEQILASHPEVFGAGELNFWQSEVDRFEAGSHRGDAAGKAIRAGAEEYLKLLLSRSGDAARVVDKMPSNFLNLGLIHAAFPRARIFHMCRNAMDTGLSIYFQTLSNTHTYARDLEDIAHYIREYRRLMHHWRTVLPPDVMLEIPYESVVDDPETWIRRIVEFAGLAWNERCLDFHQTVRTVTTASNWQVRQRMTKASVGRWRHYEKHLGPLRELSDA
jgi:hypothetical protein